VGVWSGWLSNYGLARLGPRDASLARGPGKIAKAGLTILQRPRAASQRYSPDEGPAKGGSSSREVRRSCRRIRCRSLRSKIRCPYREDLASDKRASLPLEVLCWLRPRLRSDLARGRCVRGLDTNFHHDLPIAEDGRETHPDACNDDENLSN
jgi:hypothetical protein